MSWFWNNLLLWGSVLWLPALLHGMMCSEAKFKKNVVVGVTLPQQARQDAGVQAALKAFRRQSLGVCAALTLAALPALGIRSFGLSFTLWGVWLLAVLLAPNLPFARCNQTLKALKAARGWRGQTAAAAELTVAAQPMQWLSPRQFLLPLVVSLLPLALDRQPARALVYLTDAACVLLFWLCYRHALRTKSDAVDENVALTAALTRIRRCQWNRCWLWCAWFAAALNGAVWLLRHRPGGMLAAVLGLSVLLTAAVLDAEFRTRRLQEKLTADTGAALYLDEDDQWPWGLVYYNPHDDHLVVNNRVGMGTTFNMAKRPAQAVMAGVALLLLAVPLFGLWLLHAENTPVTLTATDAALVAAHTGEEYAIPLEQITQVELVTELPAGLSRVWGTGTDTVQKGVYSSPWGSIRVCIDPRSGPWLLVSTQTNGKYLLGCTGGVAWPYGVSALTPPAAGG